jgi:hypothetical protein
VHAEMREGNSTKEYPCDTQCNAFDFQTMTEKNTAGDSQSKHKYGMGNSRTKKQTIYPIHMTNCLNSAAKLLLLFELNK